MTFWYNTISEYYLIKNERKVNTLFKNFEVQKENVMFAKDIVNKVIIEYINALENTFVFQSKLTELKVSISPIAFSRSIGSCTNDACSNAIEIKLFINPNDSTKYIAYVIAHEFAHFLFLNPYDAFSLSGKAHDDSTNYSAVTRFVEDDLTYGSSLEEMLADYLAFFIVGKISEYTDETKQFDAIFSSDSFERSIIYKLETYYGKSILDTNKIDFVTFDSDGMAYFNLFWTSIISFSFDNIIDDFDKKMGNGEFCSFCILLDDFFEEKYHSFEKVDLSNKENEIMHKLNIFCA